MVVIALLDITTAVTLRSNDAVDHVVNTSQAVRHCRVLTDLVLAMGGGDIDLVPLPMVAHAELQLIVEFIAATPPDDVRLTWRVTPSTASPITDIPRQVDGAAVWAQARLSAAGLDVQCRALLAADYLDMPLLTSAIASMNRGWGDVSAMRGDLHADLLSFVVDKTPSVVRLGQVAHSDAQRAIVRRIRDALMLGGNASLVNTDEWDASGNLLHWAVRHEDELIVAFLLTAPGIDVNAEDAGFCAPLHMAVAIGNVAIVGMLLSAPGVDANARNIGLMTPLHWAVTWGHDDVVGLLTQAPGVDVNARDSNNMTPLHRAAALGRYNLVAMLLGTARVNVNARGLNQWTPLHCAASIGHVRVVELLVRSPGIDVNAREGIQLCTPLHWAAISGHIVVVEVLLAAPAVDVNARDQRLCTPLHRAVLGGRHDLVRLLLNAPGIDVDARDSDLLTPLQWAIADGDPYMITLLTYSAANKASKGS